MDATQEIVMKACHDGLLMKNPTLYSTVKGLVEKGVPAQEIDNFLATRLMLRKGSAIRDDVYYTALHLQGQK